MSIQIECITYSRKSRRICRDNRCCHHSFGFVARRYLDTRRREKCPRGIELLRARMEIGVCASLVSSWRRAAFLEWTPLIESVNHRRCGRAALFAFNGVQVTRERAIGLQSEMSRARRCRCIVHAASTTAACVWLPSKRTNDCVISDLGPGAFWSLHHSVYTHLISCVLTHFVYKSRAKPKQLIETHVKKSDFKVRARAASIQNELIIKFKARPPAALTHSLTWMAVVVELRRRRRHRK